MIATKSFDISDTVVPSYLKTPFYEGGVFLYGSNATTPKGYNIKLWNSGVRFRLARLVQALAASFNANPNFEGIGFTETALGEAIGIPLTLTQMENYFINLATVNKRTREAFPSTMSFQFSNYPRWALVSLIPSLLSMGGGLGCPDVFLDEKGLITPPSDTASAGVYLYYPQLTGQMPLVVQVEGGNYENTRHDGTGIVPTINDLLTFARDQLQVNYIFWTRIPLYSEKVLNELNLPPQTANPEGGLKSGCPTNFKSCIN